jgi:hypothetical protein
MFLNFAVCVLPTLSTSLKTSKRNAAPLSTVSDDDSEPTAKKQSGFLIYSFANPSLLMGNQDREEGDGEAAVQEFGKGIKFMLPKCGEVELVAMTLFC